MERAHTSDRTRRRAQTRTLPLNFPAATMSRSISIAAHAKLNLALSVGDPIPPGMPNAGFHAIASWMAPISLCDQIRLTRLPDGSASSLSINWAADAPRPTPIDWPRDKDLAWRALQAMQAAAGRQLPVAIDVTKRIPAGGGLGGGSSDAAATLRGLNLLFNLGLSMPELLKVGMTLGSDVSFFLDDPPEDHNAQAEIAPGAPLALAAPPRPAIVTGFGEAIERIERIRQEILLIVPPFGMPTGPVYKEFDAWRDELFLVPRNERPPAPPEETLVRQRAHQATARAAILSEFLFNRLAVGAWRLEPRLMHILNAAARATRTHAHVTGSGACVYIPLRPGAAERALRRAADALEGRLPNTWNGPAVPGCVLLIVTTL